MAEDVTREELTQAFDAAVDSGSQTASSESTAAAAMPDDLKAFFCEHWPRIKQVLQFIGDRLGGIARTVVKGIISAGDLLHRVICR